MFAFKDRWGRFKELLAKDTLGEVLEIRFDSVPHSCHAHYSIQYCK